MGLVSTLGWSSIRGPRAVDNGEESESEEVPTDVKEETTGRSIQTNKRKNIERMKKENIKDGDYVYAEVMEGVYFRGGVIIDFKQEDQAEKELQNEEWRDDTMAASCIVKLRKISGTTFFTKGVL